MTDILKTWGECLGIIAVSLAIMFVGAGLFAGVVVLIVRGVRL